VTTPEQQAINAATQTLVSMAAFGAAIEHIATLVHENAKSKGWWSDDAGNPVDRSDAELIALEHSELSEALEGCRAGGPPDKHCPSFISQEIELADAVIRIMDHCKAKGYRLGLAIMAKHEFNKTRPHRHGGKKF
jgi:hypothetical protein